MTDRTHAPSPPCPYCGGPTVLLLDIEDDFKPDDDWCFCHRCARVIEAPPTASAPKYDQSTDSSEGADFIEQVSAQVHANWMAAKRAAGVASRKLESGEELMVPYDQLSEAAKDLDRGTVRTVLAVLPDLGYRVAPGPAIPFASGEPFQLYPENRPESVTLDVATDGTITVAEDATVAELTAALTVTARAFDMLRSQLVALSTNG